MKKIVAMVLCLVMVVGLMTGCQKAMDLDTLVRKLDDAMAAGTHMAGKANVEIDMQLAVTGMTMDMGMDMAMDMKIANDMSASWMDMDMTMDVLGESQTTDMEIYMNADGEDMVTYVHEASTDTWIKSREVGYDFQAGKDQITGIKFSEIPREKMTLAQEKETVDGRECYVLTVNMDGEYFQNLVNSTLMMSADEATSEMMESMDWSKLSAVMIYHVDAETFLPVQLSGDIQGMGDVMVGLMGQLLGGTEGLDMTVTVPNCKITMNEMAFTGVEVPAVPQEAIDNAVDADTLEEESYEDVTMEPEADGSFLMGADGVSIRVMLPEGCTAWTASQEYIEAENDEGTVYLIYELLGADLAGDIEEALMGEVDLLKEDGSYKSHSGPEELEGFTVMSITDTDDYSVWYAWREIEGYVLVISADAMGESLDMAGLLSGIEVVAE